MQRHMKRWWTFVAGALLAGCSAHTDSPAQDAGTGTPVTCQNDPRVDPYTANLTKPGSGKAFQFVLVSGDPAPPAKGNNTWQLSITDPSGAPVDGATIDVKPFMPEHGHGTSVTPTVTAAGGGKYTVTPLYLFMPGLWQVTITATKGSTSDRAVFSFCIEG